MNLRIIVFFLIGLIIFLLDVAFNSEQDSKDIYISDQELTSLLSAWQSQVGRPPNDEEIVNIINNFVQEEILYREALLLNLDEEDRIIKRRLAQKITFLKQETVPEDPSQEELKRQQIHGLNMLKMKRSELKTWLLEEILFSNPRKKKQP